MHTRLSHSVAFFGGLLLFLPAIVAAQVPGTGITPPDVIWHISNMHKHPWFYETAFASLGGWILGMVKGFSSSGDWLVRYLPSKPLPIIFVLDLLIFVVFGGYVGTGLYTPTSLIAALAAGLTWPVGLGALATKDK